MSRRKKPHEDEPDPMPEHDVDQDDSPGPNVQSRAVAELGPGVYRVSLGGVLPLVAGKPQDYLDVEADSPEDAWEKFKRINGITATIHVPEIGRLSDPE